MKIWNRWTKTYTYFTSCFSSHLQWGYFTPDWLLINSHSPYFFFHHYVPFSLFILWLLPWILFLFLYFSYAGLRAPHNITEYKRQKKKKLISSFCTLLYYIIKMEEEKHNNCRGLNFHFSNFVLKIAKKIINEEGIFLYKMAFIFINYSQTDILIRIFSSSSHPHPTRTPIHPSTLSTKYFQSLSIQVSLLSVQNTYNMQLVSWICVWREVKVRFKCNNLKWKTAILTAIYK